MIKQKYGSKFFVENYPMCGYKMFEKYYKRLEDQYRFFIVVQHNYYNSTYNTSEVYRSNNSLENIIEQLDNMDFQCATITDFRAKFPQAYKYTYYKINECQYITAHYRLRCDESVQLYKTYPSYRKANKNTKGDGSFYYKSWGKTINQTVMGARISSREIFICYNGWHMFCTKEGKTYAVHMSIASPGYNPPKVKINDTHLDYIKRVIKFMKKDSINGFYDDAIEEIKSSFGIFEN